LHAYLEELSAAGLEGQVLSWAPAAVVLSRAVPVDAIPGFHDGRVAIQDAGAQLAAPILDPIPGMRVLDACAAPGGKTLHLLEYAELGELCALDVDADRLRLVEENLARSRRHAHLVCADVRSLTQQPPPVQLPQGRLFDRILVDAPCSATGVIRRHPDIKLLRRESDLESSSRTQLEILREAFRVLVPGGRLVYCTCSVLPLENEIVVQRFLEEEHRAVLAPAVPAGRVPGAIVQQCGVQLLPGAEAGTDGFYYACLEKTTAGN
jgi:16S rRNA (cytosine967-C5)-methyltransferase